MFLVHGQLSFMIIKKPNCFQSVFLPLPKNPRVLWPSEEEKKSGITPPALRDPSLEVTHCILAHIPWQRTRPRLDAKGAGKWSPWIYSNLPGTIPHCARGNRIVFHGPDSHLCSRQVKDKQSQTQMQRWHLSRSSLQCWRADATRRHMAWGRLKGAVEVVRGKKEAIIHSFPRLGQGTTERN